MALPLVVLGALAAVGGVLNLPWGHWDLLTRWLEPVFPAAIAPEPHVATAVKVDPDPAHPGPVPGRAGPRAAALAAHDRPPEAGARGAQERLVLRRGASPPSSAARARRLADFAAYRWTRASSTGRSTGSRASPPWAAGCCASSRPATSATTPWDWRAGPRPCSCTSRCEAGADRELPHPHHHDLPARGRGPGASPWSPSPGRTSPRSSASRSRSPRRCWPSSCWSTSRRARPASSSSSRQNWIPDFGISWHLGVDGISLFLVLMTAVHLPHRHGRAQDPRPAQGVPGLDAAAGSGRASGRSWPWTCSSSS